MKEEERAREAFLNWRRAQPSGEERFPFDIAKDAFLAGAAFAHPTSATAGSAADGLREVTGETNQIGRVVIPASDPLYKAFRPKPETIAAIERNEAANAQGLAAIRDMMVGHVENWPEPKKFGTAISLVDKTLHRALAAPDDITCAGSEGAEQPVAYVSPGQFAARMSDADRDEGGTYLPMRKTMRGNFTMPLYTRPARSEPVVDGAAEVRRALALCLTLAEPTPFTSDTARAVFLAGVQGEARRIVRALPDHVGRVETGKGESDRD